MSETNGKKGFSMIVPLYRGEKYLNQVISMARNNAVALSAAGISLPFELVLVNDYPDDNANLQSNTVLSNDNTIVLLCHEKNGGIHQSRIDGLNASHGEYILFLDQDDLIADNFFVSQYTKMIRKRADFAIANGWLQGKTGNRKIYRIWLAHKITCVFNTYTRMGNHLTAPGQCLFRYDAIPQEWLQHPMRINGADDYYLLLLMGIKNEKFKPVMNRDYLYTHCYTGENCSADNDNMKRSVLELLQYIAAMPEKRAKKTYNVMAYRLGLKENGRMPKVGFADWLFITLWGIYMGCKTK